MSVQIIPLSQVDPTAIEALLDQAFGADRRQRTAYRLREGVAWLPELSFAAQDRGALVGLVQSWPVQLSGFPLVLVGPVAVAPDRQGRGLGKRLMTELVDVAGDRPLTMIGDPDYYGRFFGFSAAPTRDWQVPGPVERHRLLARSARSLPQGGRLGPRLADVAAAA